jgi:hypothetical protein
MTYTHNHSEAIHEMIWAGRAIGDVPTGEVLSDGSNHRGVKPTQLAGQPDQ